MKGLVTLWDGSRVELPELAAWELDYSAGVPCDAFWVRFPNRGQWLDTLHRAVTFTAEEGGETVFTGVVDEYALKLDGQGGYIELSGRGMAARLLDNEALPADYFTATTASILSGHVTPYGIQVGQVAELAPVPLFTIASGSSEWSVVYNFARYYNGITPRFDRLGRLVLAPFQEGTAKRLDAAQPITAIQCREKRYGVLSSVLVRNRSTLSVTQVEDSAFGAEGGCSRRVVTMPGSSSWNAMRYSGQFQLAESKKERYRLEVTLASPFWGWPGELVEVDLKSAGCQGTGRILESRAVLDGDGARTVITLGAPDNV